MLDRLQSDQFKKLAEAMKGKDLPARIAQKLENNDPTKVEDPLIILSTRTRLNFIFFQIKQSQTVPLQIQN